MSFDTIDEVSDDETYLIKQAATRGYQINKKKGIFSLKDMRTGRFICNGWRGPFSHDLQTLRIWLFALCESRVRDEHEIGIARKIAKATVEGAAAAREGGRSWNVGDVVLALLPKLEGEETASLLAAGVVRYVEAVDGQFGSPGPELLDMARDA